MEEPMERSCAQPYNLLSLEGSTATMKRLEFIPRGFIRFRAMVSEIWNSSDFTPGRNLTPPGSGVLSARAVPMKNNSSRFDND